MNTDAIYGGLQTFANNDDSNFFQPTKGWHLIVHNTDELPFESGFDFNMPENITTVLYITPELFLIDDELKKWNLEKRGCLLHGEKVLKFFTKCSRRNCEHECLSFAILKACNCVPFYLIRK